MFKWLGLGPLRVERWVIVTRLVTYMAGALTNQNRCYSTVVAGMEPRKLSREKSRVFQK